jgi:hypothetical protein
MGINSHPEGGMYEVSFGYPVDLYGYAALMPDMMKLYERASQDKEKSI